jgi:hypothetical protein
MNQAILVSLLANFGSAARNCTGLERPGGAAKREKSRGNGSEKSAAQTSSDKARRTAGIRKGDATRSIINIAYIPRVRRRPKEPKKPASRESERGSERGSARGSGRGSERAGALALTHEGEYSLLSRALLFSPPLPPLPPLAMPLHPPSPYPRTVLSRRPPPLARSAPCAPSSSRGGPLLSSLL